MLCSKIWYGNQGVFLVQRHLLLLHQAFLYKVAGCGYMLLALNICMLGTILFELYYIVLSALDTSIRLQPFPII